MCIIKMMHTSLLLLKFGGCPSYFSRQAKLAHNQAKLLYYRLYTVAWIT